MQYIEPYNTYIFVAGKNLCGTKIKFAGCREIFWGLGKKKGGGARRKITVLMPLIKGFIRRIFSTKNFIEHRVRAQRRPETAILRYLENL